MVHKLMLAADLMSGSVLNLLRNDSLSIAENIMQQRRIRHLPVIDESGKLCGILSQRDLFRGALLRTLGFGSHLAEKMLHEVLVKEAMVSEVVTVAPELPIKEVAKIMIDNKIGCVLVVGDDEILGIITESDFVKLKLTDD